MYDRNRTTVRFWEHQHLREIKTPDPYSRMIREGERTGERNVKVSLHQNLGVWYLI